MEGSPEEVFDILSDITTRKDWDEVCEGGGVVQVLGPDSKVQFMLSKGFWPTAPRDALVVGFIKRLEDGRYLNVTQSVDNAPGFVPRPGSVRMQAKLAGQIVGPHPSGKERMCRVVQIMDGIWEGGFLRVLLPCSPLKQCLFPSVASTRCSKKGNSSDFLRTR
ncbi:hypothetical protein BC829DRAFT_257103 [Chytridium lagenaria]|nr:hypothetical protein BC829DRAFT_257103 [Chytridium lagenaria]